MLHRYPLKALNKLLPFLLVILFLSACSSRPNRTTGQLATSQPTPGDRFDAERGRAQHMISEQQAELIATSWQKRELTAQDTKLGGGIGFHGWNKEWQNDGPRHLSWGCVVMHLNDIGNFYDQVPKGTMVVIF